MVVFTFCRLTTLLTQDMDLTSVLLKVGGVTLATLITSLLRDSVYGANQSTEAFYISTRVPTCYDAHPPTEHSTRHFCLCLPSTTSLTQRMHGGSLAARRRHGSKRAGCALLGSQEQYRLILPESACAHSEGLFIC